MSKEDTHDCIAGRLDVSGLESYNGETGAGHSTDQNAPSVRSVAIIDCHVRVHGATAVVMSIFSLQGDAQGKSFTEIGGSKDTWIKQHGQWYCVASHSQVLSNE